MSAVPSLPKMIKNFAVVLLLSMLLSVTGAVPRAVSADQETQVVACVEKALPAVVTLFDEQFDWSIQGSGVVIADHYLITNSHVIADMGGRVRVLFSDGIYTDGQTIAQDVSHDIALIRIARLAPRIIAWGDSDALKVGQTVILLGNMMGELPGTVTVGIVSGLHRERNLYSDLIQTDAHINWGSSGGAMLNLNCQLVGINKMIWRLEGYRILEGLSFAVPSNRIRGIVENWLEIFAYQEWLVP